MTMPLHNDGPPMDTVGTFMELIVGALGAMVGAGAVYGRMTTRIANVENRLDALEVESAAHAKGLTEALDALRRDLRSDIREVKDDLKGDVREVRTRLDAIAHRMGQ